MDIWILGKRTGRLGQGAMGFITGLILCIHLGIPAMTAQGQQPPTRVTPLPALPRYLPPIRTPRPGENTNQWHLSGRVRVRLERGDFQDVVSIFNNWIEGGNRILARGEEIQGIAFKEITEEPQKSVYRFFQQGEAMQIEVPSGARTDQPGYSTELLSVQLSNVLELYGRIAGKAMVYSPFSFSSNLTYRSQTLDRRKLAAELAQQLEARGIKLIERGEHMVLALPRSLTNLAEHLEVELGVGVASEAGALDLSAFRGDDVAAWAREFSRITGYTNRSKVLPMFLSLSDFGYSKGSRGGGSFRLGAASNALEGVAVSGLVPIVPMGERAAFGLSSSEAIKFLQLRALMAGCRFRLLEGRRFEVVRSSVALKTWVNWAQSNYKDKPGKWESALSELAAAYGVEGQSHLRMKTLKDIVLLGEASTSTNRHSGLSRSILDLADAFEAAGDAEEAELLITQYSSPEFLEDPKLADFQQSLVYRYANRRRWSDALSCSLLIPETPGFPTAKLFQNGFATGLLMLHLGKSESYLRFRSNAVDALVRSALEPSSFAWQRDPHSTSFHQAFDLTLMILATNAVTADVVKLRGMTQALSWERQQQTNVAVPVAFKDQELGSTKTNRVIPRVPARTFSFRRTGPSARDVIAGMARGLLNYREGSNSAALKELHLAASELEVVPDQWLPLRVSLYSLLAMASNRDGNRDAAIGWMAKADEWSGMAERSVGTSSCIVWQHAVLAGLLHREAQVELGAVVRPAPATQMVSRWKSWTNSLGMVFRSVPGTDVRFCIWETRVEDFDRFIHATRSRGDSTIWSWTNGAWARLGHSWRRPGFRQSPRNPVCGVSLDDAQRFCDWLSAQEKRKYRLPTNEEWNRAVGIPDSVDPSVVVPVTLKVVPDNKFPWGNSPLPLLGTQPAGNYAGEELLGVNGFGATNVIAGFKDDFAYTAPVGSFPPNQFGLYDLGGNVSEWMGDDGAETDEKWSLRGASWLVWKQETLEAGHRSKGGRTVATQSYGFRVVLERSDGD